MHLTETQINDFVDEALDDAELSRTRQHLASCTECSAEVAAVRHLLQRVTQLPAAIEPARDLRAGIWAEADRKTLWHWRYPLAAAAILLIAVTSVLTILVTRDTSQPGVRVTENTTPVDLVNLEQRYTSEVTDLQNTLRDSRDQLAPETVRILEENLRIIDHAIFEARSALARDPQSAMLGELLRSAYQRKLDLLKQAARSSASI